MRPFRVTVTQEMIDTALQSNRHRCAVVLALKFANDDFERIDVDLDGNTIRLSNRSEQLRYRWEMPPQVRRHITAFDVDRSALRPFVFTLDPSNAISVKAVAKQSVTGLIKRSARPKHPAAPGRQTSARQPAGV